MTTFVPAHVYPYASWDRLVGEYLNNALEFNPSIIPPSSHGKGAGKFKFWVDTSLTTNVFPLLRQCIAPMATPGVYNPAEWLDLYAIDIAGKRFYFKGDNISFSETVSIENMHVFGNTQLDGTLSVAGHTTLNTLAAASMSITGVGAVLTVPQINTTSLVASGTITGNIVNANSIASTGNVTGAALIGTTVTGTASVGASQYLLDGQLFVDSGGSAVSLYDPGGVQRIAMYSTGYNYYRADTHVFQSSAGLPQLQIEPDGDLVQFIGNISTAGSIAGGPITGATLSTLGNIDSGGHVNANGVYQINGIAFVAASGAQLIIYDTAEVTNITLYNTGDNYYHNTRHTFGSRGGGAVTYAQFQSSGTYNQSGSWITFSDVSLKTNISSYTRGLDAVLQLNPVTYTYVAAALASDDTRIGLLAQEVEPVIPEICGRTEIDIDGNLVTVATLAPTQLMYSLINAVKELNAKILALEERVYA